MRRPGTARRWMVTAALVAAIVGLVAIPLVYSRGGVPGGQRFTGTDSAATAEIRRSHPGYHPWVTSIFTPPAGEVESGLFAAQAALGAGFFGYALGVLRGRRRP